MRRLLPIVMALAATASVVVASDPVPAPRFEVGTAFPDIALPSLDDGRPMSIHDFRGQKVMLHVFASW